MASADHPYPPLELASRVFRLEGWGDSTRAYEEIGAQTKRAITGLLPEEWSFAGKRVLDFGCGAGRTLRHFLDEAETGEVWGADIDAPSIEWLAAELSPPLHAIRCDPLPPLDAEPGSFDLAWAVSVFTHLTDNSTPWLLELHRLLKPGGLLIASYMGRWNSEFFAGEPWNEDRVGRMVLHHTRDYDSGGPAILMSDWWLRDHWGRAFDVVEIAPQIQNMSWALLRKREVDLTAEDIERPGDDPREYPALQHNLRLVQREIARARERREARLGELARLYEESLSWRLTRPLRRLRSG